MEKPVTTVLLHILQIILWTVMFVVRVQDGKTDAWTLIMGALTVVLVVLNIIQALIIVRKLSKATKTENKKIEI